jgi:YYY domain-containing protein
MTAFFSWYVLLVLLGWLTFPLVYHLFPKLPDRGYSLSRTVGLLVWGYLFWLFGSFGISQNDLGGLLFALAILIGLSIWALLPRARPSADGDAATPPASLIDWLQANRRYLLTSELVFVVSFAFLAFVRAANPELTSAEKPMELAFINATLRSAAFPPLDPWLSGYAISYYYFGYVMTAMLAKMTGVAGSLAHNLMTALVFALAALGSHGILYNLLALAPRASVSEDTEHSATFPRSSSARHARSPDVHRPWSAVLHSWFAVMGPPSPAHRPRSSAALLAPLFLLLVSNLEGFFEVLYRRAILPASFWRWLDVREITDPPTALPGGLFERLGYWWTTDRLAGIANWFSTGLDHWFREQFIPARYLWWWRASRVVQDYDLVGSHREVIDEFPFFSFLHADLHPHVLAIPFGLLAVAVAMHIFLGGWRGSTKLFGVQLHLSLTGFVFSALVLGGLAFLNTWDILIAAALVLFAYVLARARDHGWRWERLEDFLVLVLPLGVLAVAFYLPFYLGFSSQAGGLLPNLINPARGTHLWVMFAPLLIPMLAWLVYRARLEPASLQWRRAILISVALAFLLWLLSWLLALLVQRIDPPLAQGFLASQGLTSTGALFALAGARRLSYIGSLLTLLALLVPTLALLLPNPLAKTPSRRAVHGPSSVVESSPSALGPQPFILLLILLGTLLVLLPEFIYLRDQFGTRLNTVFKFYYQAWILWSIAAAFGFAVLLQELRARWLAVLRFGMALVLVAALIYPVLSLLYKTNYFDPYFGFTLDDFDRLWRENPDEAAAIHWLRSASAGVVAEAVGDSYTGYARVSAYSGLPAVLGWPGHESQWRGGYDEQGSRRDDLTTLYTTPDWSTAETILHKYDIRYVFIGGLERAIPGLQEEKFRLHLPVAYQQGIVVVYQVP